MPDPSRGSRLNGLVDRLAAVNGTLEIQSPTGAGTRLTAHIPIPAASHLPGQPGRAIATRVGRSTT